MENFEKWLEEYTKQTGYLTGPDWYKQRKMGWKAALGWVLNHLDHSQEHKQIEDIIYEELEN